jgi:uncharacterized iron-regulated membrane protein
MCNEVFKAVWAAVGIVPVIMFLTGAIMWWNRIRVRTAQRAERRVVAAAERRLRG